MTKVHVVVGLLLQVRDKMQTGSSGLKANAMQSANVDTLWGQQFFSSSLFCFVFLSMLSPLIAFIAVLEVLQFGRDACVAESWLAGQEPLVRAAELGANVDEVESLIKRHEAFEKLAAAWEERFVQLEKLTTVSRGIWFVVEYTG